MMSEAYIQQIEKMAQNAQAWRDANPTRKAMVQFNYPPQVMLVAPISAAIENKMVSVNDAGRDLVNALWPQNVESEPSVFMVRMALELQVSNTHRLSKHARCPKCNRKLDAATGFDNRRPEAGDYSICIECEAFLEYFQNAGALMLKEATEIPPEILEQLQAVKTLLAKYKKEKTNGTDENPTRQDGRSRLRKS